MMMVDDVRLKICSKYLLKNDEVKQNV